MHKTPLDLRKTLGANSKAKTAWQEITPLARNEWICWIDSAKKSETRARRIRIAGENLSSGKRRPCCWGGCPHRK